MNFEKYYLLDTNILLEDARNIFKLSDGAKNLIILSETVLDELDSKKSGYDEINFQAREFARILENSEVLSSNKYEDFKIIRLKLINQDCKNRSKPDNDARVRPDAKTEFNRTVKRCSTGH